MSDALEPKPPECEELLQPSPFVGPSAEQRARLFHRIEASVAVAVGLDTSAPPASPPPSVAPPAAAAGTAATGLGLGKVGAVALAAFIGGAAASRVVEHTYFPPEPQVVERVVVQPAPVLPPPAVREEVPPPTPPSPPPRVERPKAPVVQPPPPISSEERQHIEGARTALLKRDGASALEALERHRRAFPKGQLAEERDSLEVQALVQAGRAEEARAAAERFKRRYPDSVFLPLP